MIATDNFKNKNIIVLGFGRSGKSAVDILVELGANVTLTTNEIISDDDLRQKLIQKNVEIIDGHHPFNILDHAHLIVKNPGIPYSIEFLKEAKRRSIDIVTEVEIASLVSEAPIIGITGTNGKTTVTHLIGEMINNDGKVAILCGNIGHPASTAVKEAGPEDIIVMELSSFQLNGTKEFKVNTAVFTNIYEAHLDYHGSKDEYVKAKLNLLKNLSENHTVVFKYEHKHFIEDIETRLNTHYFSTEFNTDAYIKDNIVYYLNEMMINLDEVMLKGMHNYENILAAISAAKAHNISNKAIIKTLKTFSGIPHRLEKVGRINGVDYYNDSKATNNLATSFALKSFKDPVIWIAGGLNRDQSIEALKPYVSYVKMVITFGQMKEQFIQFAKELNIDVLAVDNPYEAVLMSRDFAVDGDTVLFSPACASWDQYKDYEARGNHFKEGFSQL